MFFAQKPEEKISNYEHFFIRITSLANISPLRCKQSKIVYGSAVEATSVNTSLSLAGFKLK